MVMEKINRAAVLVSSCNAFNDCWKPFVKSFMDCWKDCPYNVYIISNGESFDSGCPNIHILDVGEDKKWGTNTLTALKMIDAEWIIYLQEDYFLENKISTNIIENHIHYCSTNQIDYLRLAYPFFSDSHVCGPYYATSYTKKYAVCLQAALWNKESFSKCIVDGWSGWDFEYNVIERINNVKPSFKVLGLSRKEWNKYGFKYVDGTAVRKGRWTRAAVRYLKDNGFVDVKNKRPIEGRVLSFLQENLIIPIFLRIVGIKIMNYFKWNF